MRRNAILMAVLAGGLLGCNSFRDLFSAHADVAAEAGSQQLPAQRLAQILTAGGKGVKVNRETAEYVGNVWIDYALLGQAVVHHQLPLDSASIAEAVWPDISELKGTHFHDTLVAHRASIGDASVDSLYRVPDMRVLQHILFGARPNVDSAQRRAARKKAEVTLAQIRKGASFDKLAAELSDDPGSKADSGFLPPSPKGRFVPIFDSVGWSLKPGEVSGVVETPFGYHIIKRPSLQEARDHLQDFLMERASIHLDSLYMDSLAKANKVEVLASAPAAMRSAAESPDESRKSGTSLVKYTGGELTVKDFLRWVRALPPQYSQQIREANDTTLARFARILTQNVLLLREADRNKITISTLEWESLKRRYQNQLDTLRLEMGLEDGDITDSSVAIGEREKVAGLKVERYFDDLIAGKGRLRPLPSALATLLRERLPYTVHDAGVNRAVELAKDMKAKADSSAPKGALQRAPGPPPVPGMQPAPGTPPVMRPESAQPAPARPGAANPAPATPARPPADTGAKRP